ncbi:ras and EF-hand domain-containing protein-like [Centroberyx affinis]|uniref:ras and EF-hand domain-containing protein-like n=1 Tax=Centroberyx affinis TaxID=166261 RepID=UPI003A5BE580
MASIPGVSKVEQRGLRTLFHAYDVDNSGEIEKNEFFTICQELNVPESEAENIFNRLDINKDGTVTLEEFLSGFQDRHQKEECDTEPECRNSSSKARGCARSKGPKRGVPNSADSQQGSSIKGMSAEEQDRLRTLFHTYDVDNSGEIEKNEFFTICQELNTAP